MSAKPVAIASLLTQPSMNVFRRFTVDRAKVLEFYGDVLGLKALPPIGMAGGNQMSRFQVGTSEIKLTGSTPGRQDKSGAVRETTGLRVFTFFFPDEAALTARFTSHGLPAPAFKAREGGTRGAMVLDPDSQWVELVVAAGAPPETFSRLEVGLTVSDLEKSRAFYREFVGLEELKPVESAMLGVTKYPFRHGTMTVNVWSFGKGLPANTYTAGIQYVISDVEARGREAPKRAASPSPRRSASSARACGPSGSAIRTASPTTSRSLRTQPAARNTALSISAGPSRGLRIGAARARHAPVSSETGDRRIGVAHSTVTDAADTQTLATGSKS